MILKHSNTTLVKVKFQKYRIKADIKNSNTTLVKVKYCNDSELVQEINNSNTTLVKVKLALKISDGNIAILFKYNTC